MPQNYSQQLFFFFPIPQRRERLSVAQKVDSGPKWVCVEGEMMQFKCPSKYKGTLTSLYLLQGNKVCSTCESSKIVWPRRGPI